MEMNVYCLPEKKSGVFSSLYKIPMKYSSLHICPKLKIDLTMFPIEMKENYYDKFAVVR